MTPEIRNQNMSQKRNVAQNVAEDEVLQWVTFQLDRETYGINVMQVQEVLRYTEIAAVPGAPEHYSTKQTTFDTTWNTGRTTSQQTQYQRQTTTGWE